MSNFICNNGRRYSNPFLGYQQNTHTELCPVCRGTGKYTKYHYARGQSTGNFDYSFTSTCHGCGGKGWVVVGTIYGIR